MSQKNDLRMRGGFAQNVAMNNNRSRGIGCPCCSGRVPKIGENDLKTLYPEIAKEWNYERNGTLKPEQFLPKSGKKVWWRCSVCGHEWETVIRNRTNGHGCPKYRNHPCKEQIGIAGLCAGTPNKSI